MKSLRYLIPAVVALLGLASCQDDVDAPAINDSEASWQANTTIAQLKEMYWQSLDNYIDIIKTLENGEHIYIKGTVVSSDKDGNVFRKFIIQDGTAALAISVYQYNNYLLYRPGQEVVLDCTGMYIGKYAGAIQLGWPATYLDGMQASFMPPEFLKNHIQTSGLPNPAKIDTLQLDNFNSLGTNQSDLIKMQSRLVKFNNVKFKEPGVTLSTYHENTSRTLVDVDNAETVALYTSGYCSFWTMTTPDERGDVCGILDYYNGKWQLLLIDGKGLMNFGNPTQPKGNRDNPYLVADVINTVDQAASANGWVMGYIVGAVAPGVNDQNPVSGENGVEFGSTVTLNQTIVIAPDPDITDWTKCVVVPLPQGSKLRQYGNLRDNPENYRRQIFINGRFNKTMGMPAVICSGSTADFDIVGYVMPEEISADFNSFNDGTPKSTYGTYTNATGWTLENGCVLGGSTSGANSNPRFAFIGSDETLAPTLTGKAANPGRLISPVISGGITTLGFNYGFAFSTDTQCQFTVRILQGGNEVAKRTVTVNPVEARTSLSFSWDLPQKVSGDFTIEIVNDCLGGATRDSERVSIYNLSWVK